MITADEMCKALADRNRIRIIAALFTHKELCACQINEWLAVSGATASKHLSILIRAELIINRKDGRWVFYKIQKPNPNTRKLLSWAKHQIDLDVNLQNELKDLNNVTNCSPNTIRERQRKEAALCC